MSGFCGALDKNSTSLADVTESSNSDELSWLYPAWRRLVKMLSMFRASLRGFHAGRFLPDPDPIELDLDSLLVLPASQSCGLLEKQ